MKEFVDAEIVPLFYKDRLLEVTYRRIETSKEDGEVEVNLSIVRVTDDRQNDVNIDPEDRVGISMLVMQFVAREDVEKG